MRIGVTVTFKHSVFSAGAPQTSLTIAETYSILGHTVTFIRVPIDNTDPLWWDDIKTVQSTWKSIHYSELTQDMFDIVFEIENCFIPSEKRIGNTPYVWVIRKAPLFNDIEKCVTPHEMLPRNLSGITESWLMSELTSQDDIQYVELITRRPVKVLPFVWSPLSIEIYNKETSNNTWISTRTLEPYTFSICEKNITSTSSCTLPIMIIKETLKTSNTLFKPVIQIFNGAHLKESKFFLENVLSPCMSTLPHMKLAMEGRCRIIDLCKQSNTLMISHTRFISMRNAYLDCLWSGIPLVHNLKLLCELGEYVSQGYYNNNNIIEAKEAVERMVLASKSYSIENLKTLRKTILTRFGLLSETIKQAWNTAAESTINDFKFVISTVNTLNKFAVPPIKPILEAISTPVIQSTLPTKKNIRIGFCDFWQDFNPSYNFFTLLIENHLKKTGQSTIKVDGIDLNKVEEGKEEVDILMFGPFGMRWTSAKHSIPKIHYTGENTHPIVRDDVVLNLGFQRNSPGINYMRLPLWILEINWFNADPNLLVNPKPVSIQSCINVTDNLLNSKKKFCAFVVSNPTQEVRNNAFKTLCKYKQVDSAGRLFNNMGNVISHEYGGELSKCEFLKSYKFSITYENSSSQGYTTEKLLHAKVAGCVPIYWGDPTVEMDFDIEGFIDARSCKTEEDLVRLVKEVDTNDELWRKKASIPALDTPRIHKAVDTLRECASRILSCLDISNHTATQAPPPEGVTIPQASVLPTPPIPTQPRSYETSKINIEEYDYRTNNYNTTFITGCDKGYFNYLIDNWLPCIEKYKHTSPKINAVVGLLPDVDASDQMRLLSQFPWVKIIHVPIETLPNFPDCWNPQHFLWKLFILKECASMKSLSGNLCIYTDCAVIISRWPTVYAQNALKNGISLLDDPTQINKHWCHSTFVNKMEVTNIELESNQIAACICAFVSGNPLAISLFTQAYSHGSDRQIIVGEKWSGIGPDKKPYGHRHDQSILSVLSQRMNIHRTPLYSVYNDVSLRNTYLQKKPFYVYRRLLRHHIQCVNGIDDIWLINLDRRSDRLNDFNSKHQDIQNRVIRIPAIDGKTLKLTPNIARLFAQMNPSTWMKGAMGCAMSHIIPWLHLYTETSELQSYLILEDDVILDSSWKEVWSSAYNNGCIPSNYDIIYLGGILPPNRGAFDTSALEMINNYIGKVKPNTIFGQPSPTPYFHSCAYSYVLSKAGAKKLVDILSKKSCFAHLDHVLCGSFPELNIYFLQPLVSSSKQDNDPLYRNSEFNNLKSVGQYDSDIRDGSFFTEAEIQEALSANVPYDVFSAILDAREIEGKDIINKRRFLYHSIKSEEQWLCDILQNTHISIEMLPKTLDTFPLPDDIPIVEYSIGDNFNELINMLKRWSNAGKYFYLLHVGDAACIDPIEVYGLKGCLGVIRNYIRNTINNNTNVVTIPLGYQYRLNDTKPAPRDLVWSFLGTNWHNRKELLFPFLTMPEKHFSHFVTDWFSKDKFKPDDMYSFMKSSMFVPCPNGENPETFRLYETLEAGAIPVIVRDSENKEYIDFITKHLPLKVFDDWDDAATIVQTLAKHEGKYNEYRHKVLTAWDTYKNQIKATVKRVFNL